LKHSVYLLLQGVRFSIMIRYHNHNGSKLFSHPQMVAATGESNLA